MKSADHPTSPRATERGASSVEYGLLALLIAATMVGIVLVLGTDVMGLFEDTHTSIDDASTTTTP